jgi:capsular exopolysaccharide synthesis family protein
MLKVHLRRMLIVSATLGLLAWFWAFRTPKVYQAEVEMKVGSPQLTSDNSMPISIRKVLLAGLLNDLDSDTGILKSQRIFKEGMDLAAKETRDEELGSVSMFQQLYPMYELDIPGALNSYAPDSVRVVKLKVRAMSPVAAAAIANNVAYAFSDYRKQGAATAVREAVDIVENSTKTAKSKLDEIDRKIRELKVSSNVVDLGESGRALTQSIEILRQKRASVEAELAGVLASANQLQAKLGTIDKFSDSVQTSLPDPGVDGLRQLVVQAENELAIARQTYEDAAPAVVRAKEKLAACKSRLASAEKNIRTIKGAGTSTLATAYTDTQLSLIRTQAQAKSLESQLGPINRSILEYEQKMLNMPGMESTYLDLVRNRLVNEEDYQRSQKMASELRTARDSRTTTIVSSADPRVIEAFGPVAPDVKKFVILGGFLGAMIGLAYSFARESFKLPIHTSWQLSEMTALPVAASIPALPGALAKRHSLMIKEPSFKPIESFRFMAFSLLAQEQRPNVILFSAVGDMVDSSIAAAEFAVAMSKTGSKTILVDADLRASRLSRVFGLEGRSGVADILGRTILPGESSDLFVSTEHDNLTILPAGTMSSSGMADVLTSHLQAMIGDLRDKGDTVVVHCPPVDVFADCSRLAQYVDHCYMVVSAKSTSYRSIPVAQEILEKSGAKFVGIVLTQASQTEEPFGNSAAYRSRN